MFDHPVTSPQEKRHVLRCEVRPQRSGLLSAFDELRHQRLEASPDRGYSFEAMRSARGDVLEATAARVQCERGLEEAAEADPGVGVCEGGVGEFGVLLKGILEHGVDQFFLRGEVAIERADPDAGAFADLLDRRVDAGDREELARRGDELHVVASRVAAR